MAASPWKFLVGLTRRHGKDHENAAVEDTSDKPVAEETQEPAQLQPPAASVPPTDGAQDAANPVDAHSNASDDVRNIERLVEGPDGPDEPALRQVDDHASTTGLGLQPAPVEVLATTKPRKARVFRKTNASAEIRQLRSQLAQKLQRQNAQLRKMLERFDR
ncbi:MULTISPECIES: hypothetical protein [Rhizobium]|uniref:Uncharacterized protein n=1 Tax=Rhizobium favelukesii TaxID=348824 RepID=W6S1R7_9HYPH|nr:MULTISPECIES: hypothetical protein [Rhizobium]MCS0463521.1 hypothetical protein [Rhizobium favelukesii]UFS84718.1 hypothetical protein LPB79_33295 [Rhizobium sp. T136]CDM60391.1 hypothetical protein LPU83_pLPU83b_0406 [Rhizobium favelukesii]